MEMWQQTHLNLAGNTNQKNKCPGLGQALSLGFLNSQAQLRLIPGLSLSQAEPGSNGWAMSLRPDSAHHYSS